MGFNPLEHKGMPLEDQLRPWSTISSTPYAPEEVHPYTRTRVILMNGIEVEAALFGHQFARHTDNLELKQALALQRRIEQQQQKRVNWLLSPDESPLETTLGYEQVAVDLTAWLARNEPDPNLKKALDFALLEDFDHLYRYANLYDMINGRRADEITGHLTEITPGRPTFLEHTHPYDGVRPHYDTHTVDPVSRLHVMTIVAAEQQTMNFYMTVGPDQMEPIGRSLYAEIAQIEEQHVSHYESLIDPLDSWLSRLVFHEYNEVYLYHSMAQQEVDDRIRAVWEEHLDMELGQLHAAADLLRHYEGREAAEILPPSLPDTPLTFEPNKDYVRHVLETTVGWRTDGLEYTDVEELPPDHRYFDFLDRVNAGGAPSSEVIERAVEQRGSDYRVETEGAHPVESLREPSVRREGN